MFKNLFKKTEEKQQSMTFKKDWLIILDNGHGDNTPGKRSPKFPDGSQLLEYEFNRDVVRRIAALLDEEGIEYRILVPEVNKDIALSTRAARANAYCDEYGVGKCAFISVHSNAVGMGDKWEKAKGWSVWTTKGKTNSDRFAKIMYEEAQAVFPQHGRTLLDGKVQGNGNPGPDYEENFTVIFKTKCVAILTENFFFTNKEEATWLMTDEARDLIAQVHVNAIKRWIKEK